MKTYLSAFAQFLLFYLVFCVGSLLDPFKLKWWVHHPTPTVTSYFVPDGLILTVAVYGLVLLVHGLRKHPRAARFRTAGAFMLAVLLGLMSKFGMASHDLLG